MDLGSTVAQNGQTEVKLWFLGCLGHPPLSWCIDMYSMLDCFI